MCGVADFVIHHQESLETAVSFNKVSINALVLINSLPGACGKRESKSEDYERGSHDS